jgi:hypothetical protein
MSLGWNEIILLLFIFPAILVVPITAIVAYRIGKRRGIREEQDRQRNFLSI